MNDSISASTKLNETPTMVATDSGRATAFERLPSIGRFLSSVQRVLRSIHFQRRKRRMSLCETLPLGDKRFLAIVEVESQRLLIAATNQSIALLQRLDASNVASTAEASPPSRALEKELR
jgi:flagellar biogenesis protein FliO